MCLTRLFLFFHELQDKLSILTRDYEAATAVKLKCQQEMDRTVHTIDLANRLVGGLGAEKQRWLTNVRLYAIQR